MVRAVITLLTMVCSLSLVGFQKTKMPTRASGFVIFRILKGQVEYLLLQASNGAHHWTPPKGHVDPGEDDMTTALRETQEEAGFQPSQLNVVDGFVREISYIAWGKPKVTAYYLAELIEKEAPVTLSHEHTDWKWAPIEDACRLSGYREMQEILQQAHSFIQERKSAS